LKIESGDLDVDKLAVEVKRASELIRQCQKKLRTTEEEINSIFKDLV
jgi:exodeoxyribonuclease VII small subunit